MQTSCTHKQKEYLFIYKACHCWFLNWGEDNRVILQPTTQKPKQTNHSLYSLNLLWTAKHYKDLYLIGCRAV